MMITSNNNQLQINDLSVSIGDKQVLNRITLTCSPGKVTALLGPNGAGKSTLLKVLCQEVAISRGEVLLDNNPLNNWNTNQLAKSLAVLPQHASLTFPFKVKEVVQMGLYPLSVDHLQGEKIVEQQLKRLDLIHLQDRSYPSLSGGEKQRVQLARVLTQLQQAERPPVLLLDEPTSALDLAQQHRVLGVAKKLAHQENYIVIVVLHDLNQASRYADELVVLSQGKIVTQGSADTTLTATTVNQVWHYDPLVVHAPDSQAPLLF